ncbi:hypothetical protein TPE_1394 [Treponema pedis str. T A4]|uniref:Uncharacterized protein n=1 Tax=Treponema pedis str. T A4 TaxID=1291379 RepID=S6A8I5_9SPIR|nr:hypothetical protein TPE_1394 [Treponema pedis str. T A4]
MKHNTFHKNYLYSSLHLPIFNFADIIPYLNRFFHVSVQAKTTPPLPLINAGSKGLSQKSVTFSPSPSSLKLSLCIIMT